VFEGLYQNVNTNVAFKEFNSDFFNEKTSFK